MELMERPTNFKPVMQIALYEAKDSNNHFFHAMAAELFPQAGGAPVSGAWRDLREEDVVALRKAFNAMGGTGNTGLLPESVLAVKPGGVCWWTKAARRPLLLTDKLAKECGLPADATCMWPALLFVASQGGVSVFALGDNVRPEAITELLRPPFWNVRGGSGSICWGSSPIRARLEQGVSEYIKEVEATFFLSQFAHLWGRDNRLKEMSLAEAWSEAQHKPFPVQNLRPVGRCLAEILNLNCF